MRVNSSGLVLSLGFVGFSVTFCSCFAQLKYKKVLVLVASPLPHPRRLRVCLCSLHIMSSRRRARRGVLGVFICLFCACILFYCCVFCVLARKATEDAFHHVLGRRHHGRTRRLRRTGPAHSKGEGGFVLLLDCCLLFCCSVVLIVLFYFCIFFFLGTSYVVCSLT